MPVKTIIKQCIALGKDAWLKTGKNTSQEKTQTHKKKFSPICELCFGEGYTVFVVGERAIVMPCDCYDPKIKLEKPCINDKNSPMRNDFGVCMKAGGLVGGQKNLM